MKKYVLFGLIVAFLLATAVVFAQTGGDFDLNWSSIDGSGGVLVLSGSIGQPDAVQRIAAI